MDKHNPIETTHPGPSGREINSTCLFNAPRALVFKAWSDPAHLAQWWGPKDFKNTFEVFEFKPGGEWKFTMHGPNGVDYPNHSRFSEVSESRIVFKHVGQPHFTMTVTLEDLGQQTRMSWNMLFETAEAYEGVKPFAIDGNRENFIRLQDHLVTMS